MGYILIPAEKMPESCYDNCPIQCDHYCELLQESTTDTIGEWRRLEECPLKFVKAIDDVKKIIEEK